MDALNPIESWLVQAGLAGASETESLDGFCDRCRGAGIALSRATLVVDTLHPIHEGRAFRWRAGSREQPTIVEYGPSNVGQSAASWQSSSFYHLVQTGLSRAAYRRSVLRQHRQRRSARLHRRRARRQRSEPHCGDVPVGRPQRGSCRPSLPQLRRSLNARISSPWAAMPCAAWAAPRSCSPWIQSALPDADASPARKSPFEARKRMRKALGLRP